MILTTAFLQKSLAPALRVLRRPPDRLDAYRQEFGYLGAYIHEAVVHLRNQTAGGSSSGVVAGTSLLQQYTSASNSAPGGARVMSSNLVSQLCGCLKLHRVCGMLVWICCSSRGKTRKVVTPITWYAAYRSSIICCLLALFSTSIFASMFKV